MTMEEKKKITLMGMKPVHYFILVGIFASIAILIFTVIETNNKETQTSFICVNGFKSYPVGSSYYYGWNNIIPCSMNEILPSGNVNSTMIDYYENTFTGSTVKFFKLSSNTDFGILAYEKSSQNWVFVGSNNNTFLLDPNQDRTVEVVVENYSDVDPIETVKNNQGLITNWNIGFNEDYQKEVLTFNVDLGKPYIARINVLDYSYGVNGNDGYANIPIQIIHEKLKEMSG